MAFAIGRDIGSAVTRNRLRRRLRVLADRSDLLSHGQLLIGARPAVSERSFDELGAELTMLLTTVHPGSTPVES